MLYSYTKVIPVSYSKNTIRLVHAVKQLSGTDPQTTDNFNDVVIVFERYQNNRRRGEIIN